MSWERGSTGLAFYCDALDCKSTLIYPAAVSPWFPPGSSFVECWKDASTRAGWRSFKRAGHPWGYFCPQCGSVAGMAHRQRNMEEQERERIKKRNARYTS